MSSSSTTGISSACSRRISPITTGFGRIFPSRWTAHIPAPSSHLKLVGSWPCLKLAASITIMSDRPRDSRWAIGPSGERDKENDVHSLVRFLLMVFLSMGVWMAIGLGVGFLLHRLVPAIDLGMATLIGVVTLGGCFLWLSRISTLEAIYGYDDSERSDSTWSTTPQAESRSAHRKRPRRRL